MWGCGGDSAVQPHSVGGVQGGDRRDTHTHTHRGTHTGTYTNLAPIREEQKKGGFVKGLFCKRAVLANVPSFARRGSGTRTGPLAS